MLSRELGAKLWKTRSHPAACPFNHPQLQPDASENAGRLQMTSCQINETGLRTVIMIASGRQTAVEAGDVATTHQRLSTQECPPARIQALRGTQSLAHENVR